MWFWTKTNLGLLHCALCLGMWDWLLYFWMGNVHRRDNWISLREIRKLIYCYFSQSHPSLLLSCFCLFFQVQRPMNTQKGEHTEPGKCSWLLQAVEHMNNKDWMQIPQFSEGTEVFVGKKALESWRVETMPKHQWEQLATWSTYSKRKHISCKNNLQEWWGPRGWWGGGTAQRRRKLD